MLIFHYTQLLHRRNPLTGIQHHNDIDLGTAVIDSYTHYILQYLETLGKTSKATLQDFVSFFSA